jgi:DNA-binding NtrC family response regulator
MDTSVRVLVATSNDEYRAFLTDILGAWHLQSTECSTIAEARRAISDSPVSLVFCDTKLPDGDFTALLSVSSRQAPPKVVVLLRENEEYANAIGMGAFDALPVPCQRQDVQWMLIQGMRDDKKKRGRYDLSKMLDEGGYRGSGVVEGLTSSAIHSVPDLSGNHLDDGEPELDEKPKSGTYLL